MLSLDQIDDHDSMTIIMWIRTQVSVAGQRTAGERGQRGGDPVPVGHANPPRPGCRICGSPLLREPQRVLVHHSAGCAPAMANGRLDHQ